MMPKNNIILLSTIDCPACERIKEILNKKQIKFKEINNVDYILEKGFGQVPVLIVDDENYVGSAAFRWVEAYNESN